MKKGDKRVFLERMFGLEIYSEMNKLCNEKLRGLSDKEYKINTDIESINEKIESCKRLKIKFQLEIKSKQETIEKVNEIKEEYERLLESNPNLQEETESLNIKINEKEEKFQKVTLQFEKWKARLDAEISHLEREIKQIEKLEEQRKKNKEIQGKIEKIQEETGKIEKIQENLKKLTKEEDRLSNDFDKKFVEQSDIEKDLVKLNTELETVEKNLEQLKTGVCPTCGQDVKDPQDHYKKERTTIKKNVTKKSNKLFAVKAEKQSIMDDLKAVRDKKSTLDNAKEKLYRLENQIKEAGSEEKADELRDEKNSNIEKMQEALVKYNEKSEKHKTELEALKNKLTDLVREQSTISTKKRELELAESEAKSDQKHIESLQKMIDDQNDDIEKAKDKKESLSKTVLKFKDISDYLNAIKDILKDENIKQYTIKQIMPFLNKQVNYYLSEVNYGFYVKIDKWLDVDIKGPGIRNATYGNLSGGERRGLDISLQLSLLDVSRSQAGIFPDLLVLDELLDSSIDARGIHELMKIIKFKQKEFDGKIFVISHRDEIDGDLIDYLYKAVKKDGFSEIVY
jgi:DNA repair exonuclease SbcCD ATPase subunit